MTKKVFNKIPWFIIWIVVAIPILVCLIVTLIYKEEFGPIIPVILLIGICEDLIPFGIFIFVLKKIEFQESVSIKYGIMGAFILLLLSQLFWEVIFWMNVYTPPHDSTFTTSIFILTSGAVGSIGYGIGWLIGHLVLTNKKSS